MIFKKYKFMFLGLVILLGLGACTLKPTSSDINTTPTTPVSTSTVPTTSSADPVPIDTRYTDGLKLDLARGSSKNGTYVGREFFQGGVSLATFNACIDGDTSTFTIEGRRETVRYLGINTPESTAVIEPWGKEASKYNCEILTNARKNNIPIYLEAEDHGLDATGKRYLAWVWVGERLLNLETLEQAYTKFTVTTETHYWDIFRAAEAKAIASQKRHAGGEIDSTFNYDKSVKNLTIKELVENFTNYLDGSVVQVRGVITRIISGSIYIQQAEYDEVNDITKQYSIYLYTGPGGADLSYLSLGDDIIVIGQANTFNEARQLSIASYIRKINILSSNNEVIITQIPSGSINVADYAYMLLKFNNAKITKKEKSTSPSGDYTAYMKLDGGTGQEIQLRVSAYRTNDPYIGVLEVGNLVNITGILTQYYEGYQLLITADKTLNDVELIN